MLYAVFGIGIGNFGARCDLPMAEWVDRLNAHLSAQKPFIRVTDRFGSTGNFLVECSSPDVAKVGARFGRVGETAWVVHSIGDVREALITLEKLPAPAEEKDVRWTKGLAFCGQPDATKREALLTTDRAVLRKIAPCIVAVFKRDRISANGRLDRNHRGGGWGAISNELERRLGGRWTARSRRTIDGLVRKAVGCNFR